MRKHTTPKQNRRQFRSAETRREGEYLTADHSTQLQGGCLVPSPPSSLLSSFPFLSPLQQAFLHLHPHEKSPVSSFHNSFSPDSNIAYSESSFTHPPSTSQHLYNAIATEKCLRNSTFNLFANHVGIRDKKLILIHKLLYDVFPLHQQLVRWSFFF